MIFIFGSIIISQNDHKAKFSLFFNKHSACLFFFAQNINIAPIYFQLGEGEEAQK